MKDENCMRKPRMMQMCLIENSNFERNHKN